MWEIVKSVVIEAIINALLEIAKTLRRVRREKEVEIREVRESLQSGDLKIGDSVTVIGTYSEFVPFINMSEIVGLSVKPDTSPLPVCGACKVGPTNDEYVGAILEEELRGIHRDSKCIPVFFSQKYSKSSIKTLNFITGDIVELRAVISPIPTIWRDIIISSDFFSFAREDRLKQPFCLKVYDCEPHGLHLNEFRIDLWSLVHFQRPTLPLTTPEQLAMIEARAPDRLIVENVFPSTFQFIFPGVNLVNAEGTRERESLLGSFVSEFPELYFDMMRIVGDWKKNVVPVKDAQIKYVHDASFSHFKSKPIEVSPLTKKYFKQIDRTNDAAFGHLPHDMIPREWKKITGKIIKEAKNILSLWAILLC